MSINWADALRIAGIGFGSVFLILIILALGVVLVSYCARRINKEPDHTKSQPKEKG